MFLIRVACLLIAWYIVTYIGGSFYTWDFNPGSWPADVRLKKLAADLLWTCFVVIISPVLIPSKGSK